MVGFIYILDCSNSSSFPFWSSKFTCNKNGGSNGNSIDQLRYNFAVTLKR